MDSSIATWSEAGLHAEDVKKIRTSVSEALRPQDRLNPVLGVRILAATVREQNRTQEELLEERKNLYKKVDELDSQITALEFEMKDLRVFKEKMNGPKCAKHDLPFILSSGVGKPCCPDCVRSAQVAERAKTKSRLGVLLPLGTVLVGTAASAEYNMKTLSEAAMLAMQYFGVW